MSVVEALLNLGAKGAGRIRTAHKPLLRLARRRARTAEHRGYRREAAAIDREIARVAAGRSPIVVGPWLAEVGYEVLYWIPFLRWFADTYGVSAERLTVISRGGLEPLYRDVGSRYVDMFDVATADQVAARNAVRRATHEQGGQKQSSASDFDRELIEAARTRIGANDVNVLHPSLMFRLFRQVWYGNLPFDVLWRHTRYVRVALDRSLALEALPDEFVAVKLYEGPAFSAAMASVDAVRHLVAQTARHLPVVTLDTAVRVDEHRDIDLSGIPNVTSAGTLMTPRSNLAIQIALIARSRFFLSTCGGLAWLAPFLGTPTVAVYDQDRLLAPHLFVARQAMAAAGAAAMSPLDVSALARFGANFDGSAPDPSGGRPE
jgi:hypothetical protein